MKTELIIPRKMEGKRTFPLLAQSVSSKTVVRFVEERQGTKLIERDGSSAIDGEEGWSSCFITDIWTILPPGTKVVLTQE